MSQFTTPVARVIGGNLYDKKPNKPKPGQPFDPNKTMMVDFGVAIPKTPGRDWKQEPTWGAIIHKVGVDAFTAGVADHPSFAWKIIDGDSPTATTAGTTPPNQREGYPGHWVLWFSGSTPPTIYNANGTQVIAEKGVVKPGYYVQVFGNAKENGNKPGNPEQKKPGIYLNHTYVAFVAKGEEITSKPDVAAAGFGQNTGVMPAGAIAVNAAPASALPSGGFAPAPGPVAVAPHPGILPGPAGVPADPAPREPQLVMTAKANGYTLDQFLANPAWTRENLVAEGYAVWQ